MRKNFILALAVASIFVAILCSGNAQSSSSPLFDVVNALKQQQAQIADNQNNVDDKINSLTEEIRVARLYMSRGGGKHKPLPIPKK
jgi:peptidoglycan hydrolase CwlO-like protein